MKTSTQLKALIRNLSKEKNINSEILIRNFMLERLLERISLSKYKNKFVLKGGMLIASLVGIETRATVDMDTTVRGIELNEHEIEKIFNEVLNLPINDEVIMSLSKIENIRDESDYPGLRLSITAVLDKTKQTIKVDITTGDKITPNAIRHSFRMMFSDKSLSILAYNLETVLSEKIETVLSRGTTNTRMRDFYDVHVLYRLYLNNLDYDVLKSAFKETATHRGTYNTIVSNHADNIQTIISSDDLEVLWKQYQKKNDYALNVQWNEALISMQELLDKINLN